MAKNTLFATKALSFERKKRGLSQQEMADLLSIKLKRNISLGTYQSWEYQNRSISTNDAVLISRELDIPLKTLWKVK